MKTLKPVLTSLRLMLVIYSCSAGARVVLPPPRSVNGDPSSAPGPVYTPGCSGELLVARPPKPDSQAITITAFFPLPRDDLSNTTAPSTPTALHYLLPAAVIAMEEVNQIMDGYHLQLDVRNTECDRFVAIKELTESLYDSSTTNTPHLAVLGPGCLDVTTALSPLAHGLLLPLVSYANDTNVPVISAADRRAEFPDLFQMVRNVYHVAKTALRVMDYFEWTEQVAFVYDDDLIYAKTVEQLASTTGGDFTLRDRNGSIAISVPDGVLLRLPAKEKTKPISNFMSSVQGQFIRVIAGLVGEDSACKIVCEGKQGTIPGDGFVYIFVGAYQEEWWLNEASCPCQLKASDVESVILVSSQVKNTLSNDVFELGSTLSELKQRYADRLNTWCPETRDSKLDTFFATTYDALLALGLAINNSLPVLNVSIDDYYHNGTVVPTSVYQAILNSLSNSNFTGASGQVTFTSSGERVGIDVVQQIQDGTLALVGTYNSAVDKLEINESRLRWPGDGGTPRLYPEDDQKTATRAVLIFAGLVTLASHVFSLVMMGFVIRHRRHRIFLASGQRLNYIIFAGVYVAFTTIYIFILLESRLGPKMPTNLFSFFCIVRLYLIMLGFTLTFGTLFVRAWRIYRIFNNPFVAKRKYTDTHLMLIVGFLALIDLILVTVFVSADSYGRSVSRADADFDTFTACTYLGCFSKRFFLIGTLILAMYKILQMLLFIFVVSLVRRGVIERKIYDDSKFLALALYMTAVVFFIGLPLQVLLSVSFKIAESLAVNMLWVNISANVTLCAIYIPKLYQIIYKKVDVRKLMTQKSKFYIYSSESTFL